MRRDPNLSGASKHRGHIGSTPPRPRDFWQQAFVLTILIRAYDYLDVVQFMGAGGEGRGEGAQISPK